ncbi:MAG: pyruvate kinase [Patescibacteria group bacterium]|nr:pyruvate kinase [Patescibacteria group bacterium]
MIFDKKTKIVCTIGPATKSEEQLIKLLEAGMNVVRMNFSHGDFAEHQEKVDNLKKAIEKTGISCATLQDLSGPKFRIGDFYQEKVELKIGEYITLTTEDIIGDEKRVSVNYSTLHEEISVGNIIMIDDGKKKIEVVEIKGREIKCKILIGGLIKGRRGLNLPNSSIKISALTDKDKKDIEFGINNDVDIFAFSFVRRPSDVEELRKILKNKKSKARIMAKIETVEAVENFDAILELTDMIMVARGDLSVELGQENVPVTQKMIIDKCIKAGKPVVTATQMLESMIKNPTPTRAEVSDVANAIFDGTDAVMLSEETTLGEFPIEAVKVMSQIAEKVENSEIYKSRFYDAKLSSNDLFSSHRLVDVVTSEAVDIAHKLKAKVIVALTDTGRTARMISRYKPMQQILSFTKEEKTFNQLLISYGCKPVFISKMNTLNEVMPIVREVLLSKKIFKKGDSVVIVAGIPFGKSLDTNMVLVDVL